MGVTQAIPANRRTISDEKITEKKITEQEFLRLPEDGRKWELVDGEAKEVPAGHKHDILVINIGAMLKPFARGRGFVAGSQAGFRMASGNVRSPDVSFTRKERLPQGEPANGFEGFAPDLAIEIISPSEEPDDRARKVAEYFGAGAEQVWHLFPEMKRVIVYYSPFETATFQSEETLTGGDLLSGFSCVVEALFDLE